LSALQFLARHPALLGFVAFVVVAFVLWSKIVDPFITLWNEQPPFGFIIGTRKQRERIRQRLRETGERQSRPK